jgi:hypothetical protein
VLAHDVTLREMASTRQMSRSTLSAATRRQSRLESKQEQERDRIGVKRLSEKSRDKPKSKSAIG